LSGPNFLLLATLAASMSVCTVAQDWQETASPQTHSTAGEKSPRVFHKDGLGSATYKLWLEEDVTWIITDPERAAFLKLSNDEERNNFIEQFWLRRDPSPETIENEYRDEHYRRIAYANERFATRIPGWKTDRGRIYIMYGPPDGIERATEEVPAEGKENQQDRLSLPAETWRYRYLPGIGQDVKIKFVDTCRCGDYKLAIDSVQAQKDAILLTPYENPCGHQKNGTIIDCIIVDISSQRPPRPKFRDLEEIVTHKITMNMVPFRARADFIKLTHLSDAMSLTIGVDNKDVAWKHADASHTMRVEIFGRVTSLTGRIVQQFEGVMSETVSDDNWSKVADKTSVWGKTLVLESGRYRLDLAVKDANGDHVGTLSRGLIVPDHFGNSLEVSSLILADKMENWPAKNAMPGKFVVGSTELRPRVQSTDGTVAGRVIFKQDEKLNIWMQVYNLAIDEKTQKPNAVFLYKIADLKNKLRVFQSSQRSDQLDIAGEQITLKNGVSLSGLEPGDYQLTVAVKDTIAGRSISLTADFQIVP
jgi:GWxTD domain-containing protein